jgi:hypothetical protein
VAPKAKPKAKPAKSARSRLYWWVAPNSSSRLSCQSGKKEGWHQNCQILTFANILILLEEQLGHPLLLVGGTKFFTQPSN